MAEIGYARVSTSDQHLEPQLELLQQAGCEKVFQEKLSGSSTENRPALQSMIEYIREGDRVTVAKLDRIARSTIDLLNLVDSFNKKGVEFRVLNINLDTSTSTGKLMLSMLAAIGQFERELMLERQREGIKFAKARGAYKGRKPTARMKAAEVRLMVSDGKSKAAVARELNISEASVYRILAS